MSRVGGYARLWRADYAVRDAATFNAKLNRLAVFTALGRAARVIELERDGDAWQLVEWVDAEDEESGIALARWRDVDEPTAVALASAFLEGVLYELVEREFWSAQDLD